jgi:Zn-dependent peptidase ImmA (M78 family)
VLSPDDRRKIGRLYEEDSVKIPQLATRFAVSNQAIRYVLAELKLLRTKRKTQKCGASASTN